MYQHNVLRTKCRETIPQKFGNQQPLILWSLLKIYIIIVIREDVKKFCKNGFISVKVRELITGINANVKHNPEHRPVDPVIYPLFKLHKLSSDQIR